MKLYALVWNQRKANKGSLLNRKERLYEQEATDAKEAASQGRSYKMLYQTVRPLSGSGPNQRKPIRNKKADVFSKNL